MRVLLEFIWNSEHLYLATPLMQLEHIRIAIRNERKYYVAK